jgi:hypothetical protein
MEPEHRRHISIQQDMLAANPIRKTTEQTNHFLLKLHLEQYCSAFISNNTKIQTSYATQHASTHELVAPRSSEKKRSLFHVLLAHTSSCCARSREGNMPGKDRPIPWLLHTETTRRRQFYQTAATAMFPWPSMSECRRWWHIAPPSAALPSHVVPHQPP